jgi:hypothetical protein
MDKFKVFKVVANVAVVLTALGTILYENTFTRIDVVDAEVVALTVVKAHIKTTLIPYKVQEETVAANYKVKFEFKGRSYISSFPNNKFGGWKQGMHRKMQYVCSPIFGLGGHLIPVVR